MLCPRLSLTLLAELYDLEEDACRVCDREAKRLARRPPAVTLRTVVAHAYETVEELPSLARARDVQIKSFRAAVSDTFRRLRDIVVDRVVDQEQAYRRTLGVLHRGIDLVHLARAAAYTEGDDGLTLWCQHWLEAREPLVSDLTDGLRFFARHPLFAQLPSAAIPSTGY